MHTNKEIARKIAKQMNQRYNRWMIPSVIVRRVESSADDEVLEWEQFHTISSLPSSPYPTDRQRFWMMIRSRQQY